ncbi:hypothetical protein lerEdw1_000270 [Lerista edwardsae]|nr:hypothetical protein lerEdw1_000270 [Lerista edwardsae]
MKVAQKPKEVKLVHHGKKTAHRVDFITLPVTATDPQSFLIQGDDTLQVEVKMNLGSNTEGDCLGRFVADSWVDGPPPGLGNGLADTIPFQVYTHKIRQENDMVDSAPQWEAVLRRQKEKNQSDPNHRRSKHRSRSRSPDVQAKEELWKHIQKDLVDPSGLSEEQLREIPYTKIETQGDPIRIRHSHSPRSYRQYRRSQCSDGERSVLSEVNSKTDLVPPLPVTRSSDAQCSNMTVSQQKRNGSKDSLIEDMSQASLDNLDGKHSTKTIKIVQTSRLKLET